MIKRCVLVFPLFIFLLSGFFGCSSDKVIRREISESPFLEAALSANENMVHMTATEAYFDGQRLYANYLQGNLVYYAMGQWKGSEDSASLPRLKTDTIVGGIVLPLEQHSTRPWKDLPADANPVLVLGSEVWDALMTQVFDRILPDEPLTGVIVDLFTREYFLYSDENSRSRVTSLAAKPGRIGIGRVWTFSQLLDITLPYLENYLVKNGIEDRQVLINTGDSGL